MINWWNSLSGLQQGFAYIAIPATLILAIQTVLMIFGMGSEGADADMPDVPDIDVDIDVGADLGVDMIPAAGDVSDAVSVSDAADAGLRIFTIRGFVAFFSVFGWCGLAMSRAGVGGFWSLLVSFAAGSLAMIIMAALFKAALKLQADGTMNIENAVGSSASVYLTIPQKRDGKGKVTATVQGQLCEFEAVTDEDSVIKTGAEVVVVGISGKDTLIVCRR